MKSVGIMMVIGGAVLILLGLVFMLGGRIPFLGNLPGDINVKKGNFEFHFPIVTCLVISVILTALATLVLKFLKR